MTQPVDGSLALQEQPTLRLGLYGFDPEQRAKLEASVASANTPSRWRVCDFAHADAWWVNGAQVRLLDDGDLELAPGHAGETRLKLNMSQADRPIAFARPLSQEQFDPLYTFDPASSAGAHGTLLQFEIWLRMLRAQFALGKCVITRGAALRHTIHHLFHKSHLLAVLNFRTGQAALSPHLHPNDVQHAHWEKRPVGAGDAPPHFVGFSIGQLSWTYADRTDNNTLPERYLSSAIFYRHAPRVPPSWLRDSQLMLLRELIIGPGSLDSLCQRTGLPRDQSERDLACLFYAGAVTTTSMKAARPALLGLDSGSTKSSFDSMALWPAQDSAIRIDITAPAAFDRH